MATGAGGWAAGNALWCYVALADTTPVSNSSAAELGYVVLPLCAVGATVLVPNHDDYGFALGLLLDGIIVAASLFLALGSLALGAADRVSIPRILLAVITAIYLGSVVIALIVVWIGEPGRRASPALLSAGFAAIGMAGALHLHENRADPDAVVTLGWISGAYFLALSAIASRPGPDLDTRTSHSFSRLSMWVPYLPVSAAIVVFAVHFWPADRVDAFLFSTGMVLSVAILVRHLLALDRKRRLLEAMADAALRDTLTGLANRRLLDERLAHAVQLHLRLAIPVSLLRVRVDDFNVVNDTLGYAASDELLRSVGARIQASVRAGDTVAGMGGDEFAILVEDRPEVAAQVGKRLARAFDSALDIGGNRVYVHLSIGVATAGSEALLRWEHSTLGILEPREFLPLIREHGLMERRDRSGAFSGDRGCFGSASVRCFNPGRHQSVGAFPRRWHPAGPHHVCAGFTRHVGQPADSGDHRGIDGGRLRHGTRGPESSTASRYPGIDRRLRQRLLQADLSA